MTADQHERPAWIPEALYPFESHYVEIDGATVHYVDEGGGPPLLLLHGNPTWSFLYRDIIIGLRDRYRCIAPDHPGFGLSRAAPGYGYTPTSRWYPGEIIEDAHLLPIPAAVGSGSYRLVVGLYDLATVTPLPVAQTGQPPAQRALLTTLESR